jgi:flagellar motility protein MotE (MotC chaperone)
MSRGFFAFCKILIILLGICLTLGILNFMGALKVKDLFIQGLSYIPGLTDLAENYELGKKRSKLLGEREADLIAREEQLQRDQAKLEEEQDLLLAEKLAWEREHPVSGGPDGTVKISPAQQAALAKEEAKLKYYLATLGSMKPKNAAMVIQKLPEETIYLIFDQLQQSQVRKILENMPAEYLAKLTQDRLNKYRNR